MNIYDFSVTKYDGKVEKLDQYKGKVMLIVNSATHCGFTPQYEDLKHLHDEYASKGLVILDFPCDQFGNQAPGTNQEIMDFCINRYMLPYELYSKIDVNGEGADPLFTYLKDQKGFTGFDAKHPLSRVLMINLSKADPDFECNPDIKWNFTKFLVDRDGNVVDRFEPVDNMCRVEEIINAIL